jgi:hypothetical protein
MRLISYHPGVTIDFIKNKTGFDLKIAPDVTMTPKPTAEELYRLRTEIDPLSIRRLELLSGVERRDLLKLIIQKESKVTAVLDD